MPRHITRLRITNFRGIEHLDRKVPPGGMIAKGTNGAGKTSLLKAIRAALIAKDISPDAIRTGEDGAEIIVDFDDVTVRRRISASGGSLVVINDDGTPKGKPQTWLTEVLGDAAIDPIEFFTAKPDKRREQVLRAIPIKLAEEQIRAWLQGFPGAAEEAIASGVLTKHGLDACNELYKLAYARRTAANTAVRTAGDELKRVQVDKVDLPDIPIEQADADRARAEADAARAALAGREQRLRTSGDRTKSTRDRIAALRDGAATLREQYPVAGSDALYDLMQVHKAAEAKVARLELELAEARAAVGPAKAAAEAEGDRLDLIDRKRRQADEDCATANNLEDALKDVAEAAITDDDRAAVAAKIEDAAALMADAEATTKATDWQKRHDVAKAAMEGAKTKADNLDQQVKLWETTAPKTLIEGGKGIPGMTLDGDKILMDGIAIDGLSGREQLLFAVEIARRSQAQSKILIVDGLEAVAPDMLDDFILAATADGFQLIATRVDAGRITYEAVEVAP